MDIIVITQESLEVFIDKAINKALKANMPKEPEKLYTINQVAKKLGLAHSTIKKKVTAGIIKTTVDGHIPESAINEYLGRPP